MEDPEGAMVQFFDASLDTAHILEAVTVLLAFVVLLWSVLHRPRIARPVKENNIDDGDRYKE